MIEDEDIDGLAAEYVLGSLNAAERDQVAVRRRTDRQLAEAITAWERRLGPLSDRAPELAPPAYLLDGILSRISDQTTRSTELAGVVALRRASSRRWPVAAAVSALAACLVLGVAWFNNRQPQRPVLAQMDCGKLYKDFWQKRDPQANARISPEQLAGISRMVLRAYDACQAGDEQDARALLARLREHSGGAPPRRRILPG